MGAQPTPTLQHCYAERYIEARRVKGHSLKLLGEETIEQKLQKVKVAVTST
ncbi:hypothetical protein DPMN_112753 [Dreissena polymorpha]|uniref:Uncharacterized protein n=1 Tax=Dreissena polymorpha TaxID=45954 RepID=A0A9D4QR72_DREPO|nr:hypothetical protein DPMN_112753 [Dreissena polymorpha]